MTFVYIWEVYNPISVTKTLRTKKATRKGKIYNQFYRVGNAIQHKSNWLSINIKSYQSIIFSFIKSEKAQLGFSI